MAEFKVNLNGLEQCADSGQQMSRRIAAMEHELEDILGRLSIHSASAGVIRKMLRQNMQSMQGNADKFHAMSEALLQARQIYQGTEQKILGQKEREELKKKLGGLTDRMRETGPVVGLENAGCYGGDPVNLCNGNYIYEKEFLLIDGTVPLEFHAFYNGLQERSGVLGKGWDHNYEASLSRDGDTVRISRGDGYQQTFFKTGEGQYTGFNGTFETLEETEEVYLLKNRESEILAFSKAGRLLSKKNTDGAGLVFTYDKGGKLEEAKNQTGEYLLFEYEQEHLVCIRDHMGRKISFGYRDHLLCEAVDPAGETLRYEYTGRGKLSTIIRADGVVMLKNTYDSRDRILTQQFPDGGEIRYEYLDEKNQVVITEQNGNRVICEHDKRYRNTRNIYEDGEETFTYNDQNQKTSYTDKRGHRNIFRYDGRGNLVCFENAEGVSLDMGYNGEDKICEVGINGAWMYQAEYDEKGHQKAVQDVLGGRTEFSYDGQGNVTAVVQPDGSCTKMEYDEAGHVTSILYPLGSRVCYVYDQLHRVTESIDGNGNITRYSYNSKDELIRVTNADGHTQYYEYDKNGNVVRFQDYDQNEIRISYNEMNKPVCIRDKNGNHTKIQYDKMGNPVKVTDPEDAVTAYEYDRQQHVTGIQMPDGTRTGLSYDPCGNLVRRTTPEGHVYEFTYDKINRPIVVKEPDGTVRSASYNRFGQVESVVYPDGSKESYEYDRLGRMIIRTDRSGYTVYLGYSRLGLLESVSDDRGCLEKYEYYPGGLLKHEYYADGRSRTYTYDGNRNIASVTDQNKSCWELTYDSLDRVTKAVNSDGPSEVYEYDAVGNLLRITNGEQETTRYEYSPMGELVRVIDPMGNETFYTYDKRSELTGIYQARSGHPDMEKIMQMNQEQKDIRRTLYTRDAAGRITCAQDALGNETQYTYDGGGHITSMLDADGNLTKYHYYPDGSQKQICFADGRQIQMRYNSLRELTEMEDWLGITRIKRDSAGNITSIEDPSGDCLKMQWSRRGECTGMEYPDGTIAEYAYNSASQITEFFQDGSKVKYAYYDNGLMKEKQFSGGGFSRYQYNKLGQITGLCHGDAAGIFSERTFSYDKAGRRRGAVRKGSMEGEASGSYEYQYTPAGCLEAVIRDGQMLQHYSYDVFGNRRYMDEQGKVSRYEYNDLDQLIGCDEGSRHFKYLYDRRGNMTEESCNGQSLRSFRFGALNLLEEIQNPGGRTVYQYNGFGNRVGESGFDAEDQLLETVRYLNHPGRDYNNLISSVRGEERVDYFWDKGLIRETCGQESRFFCLDELLTPAGSFGQGEFSSGDIFGRGGNTAGRDGFGFTGYRAERAEGILFAQQREYMPAHGRFMSPDPIPGNIWNPMTMNAYLYCMSDPVNFVDYTGMIAAWLAGGIVGSVFNVAKKLAGDVVKSVRQGKWTMSSWQSYIGTAAGGFLSGSVLMATGNAMIAGAAGDSVETFITGGLEKATGAPNTAGKSWGSIFTDTLRDGVLGGAGGFAFGNVGKYIKIPGITSGKGSFMSVWKQVVTKTQRGLIKNVTTKTLLKGLTAYGGMKFIDQLIDSGRRTALEDIKNWGHERIQAMIERLFPQAAVVGGSGVLTGTVLANLTMNPGINIHCFAGGT